MTLAYQVAPVFYTPTQLTTKGELKCFGESPFIFNIVQLENHRWGSPFGLDWSDVDADYDTGWVVISKSHGPIANPRAHVQYSISYL